MHSIKVPIKKAEKVKQFMLKNNIYDKNYSIHKNNINIYFPLTSKQNIQQIKNKFPTITLSQVKLKKRESKNIKNQLLTKLSKQELSKIKTSYDIIGTIAIIEIDPCLEKKEKIIAQTILKLHPSLDSVYKKIDIYKGEYRTRKLEYISGKKSKETTHKENNVLLKLDVESCYFSPRSCTERKRISSLIKKGETILVMFSGIAPLPAVISKNTKAEKIIGIELNPLAHKYALLNIKLNKLKNIELINGDVKKKNPTFKQKFDRILMPLPKTGEYFIEDALKVAKKGTIIHYYAFHDETQFNQLKKKIKNYFKYRKINILKIIKCGQYSPHVFRICADIEVIE